MTRTVVALFDDFNAAKSLVEDMVQRGFTRENISLVANDQTGQYSSDEVSTVDGYDDKRAASEAGLGAAIGGIAGLLIGLGTFLIPGVGPVLVAGPIVAVLGGAGIGAMAGGLVGALSESGISEDDANTFTQGIRRGGVLVLAFVPDDRADQAADLMNHYDPVDIDRRAKEWNAINWAGDGLGSDEFAFDHKRNHIDEPRTGTSVRTYAGRTLNRESTGTMDDNPNAGVEQTDWRMYESRFREHYENMYAGHGSWQDYRESYRYGFEHGNRGYYPNAAWEEVGPEMRLGWEKEHRHWNWADHEEAVRQGWLVRRPAR